MHSRIRWLTVVLITVLVPINCWWIAATLFNGGVSPTQVSLYFNAIFSILILILINRLFGLSYRSRPIFNRVELLTIYTCVSVGSSLAGVDRMMVMVPLIGHAHWFATPENDWTNLFHHYIPTWLSISDKHVLKDYYQGFSTFYISQNLFAWLPVIFWWSLFLFVLHLMMLGINIILRKQWVESERLSYPIIQLPVEMTQSKGRFFKSTWMWLGFILGLTVNIVNGLNFLLPHVPSLGGKLYDLQALLTERPWNAIG